MPKLKPGTILPTPDEDAAITTAAQADPDALPLTDAEWTAVKHEVRRGRRHHVRRELAAQELELMQSVGAGVPKGDRLRLEFTAEGDTRIVFNNQLLKTVTGGGLAAPKR